MLPRREEESTELVIKPVRNRSLSSLVRYGIATMFAVYLFVPPSAAPSRQADALDGSALDEARLIAEELALGGPRPIYGQDGRRDWGQIQDPLVRSRAIASVALIRSSELSSDGEDFLQSTAKT